MNKLIEYIKFLGIPLPHSDDPVIMFALIVLVLSVCSLLGFINIMLYFFTLLYFDSFFIKS